MKKICMVLFLVTLAVAPLCAQSAAPTGGIPMPYRSGYMTGMVVDLVGYALVVTGSALTFLAPDATLPLFGLGTLTMTAGGFVQNAYLGKYQAALDAAGAGIPVSAGRTSKILSWVSAGCVAAALAIGPAELAGDATDVITLVLMGGALVCESVNLFSVRNAWGSTLIKANQSAPLASLDAYPGIAVRWDPDSNTAALELMLDIRL
jgi:hypothetical protein